MSQLLAVVGATVWDPGSDTTIPDAVVLIDGDRIQEVRPSSAVELPAHARVFRRDPSEWVIPGLINLHGHFSLDGGPAPVESLTAEPLLMTAIRATGHARLALQTGVTTIRELGSREGLSIVLRDAVDRGYVEGPRILASGQAVTITGGHSTHIGTQADGVDGVIRAVREQAARRADLIKLIASGGNSRADRKLTAPGLSPAELVAAVDEAHRHHLKVAAHAHTTDAIANAVEAGVDTIEHGTFLSADTAKAMARAGVALVSTLAVHHNANAVQTDDPRVLAFRARVTGQAAARVESFRLALEHGVKVGAGSDAGTILNGHGEFLAELRLLHAAGLDRADTIRAATAWAARIIGDDSLGAVAAGAKADLLVLPRDPREDLEAIADVKALLVRGVPSLGDWSAAEVGTPA